MVRSASFQKLKSQKWDVVVIGGGATGAGCALDAATRGMQVALIEKNDFAHGTSSKSTKLLHGGVRYLEQAVRDLDVGQYHLVREALEERARLLELAPHLTRVLPILTPLYRHWELPYYFTGLKLYDWLSGRHGLKSSQYVSKSRALELCPVLRHRVPKSGVLYYDGQFDDARLNLALVSTSVKHGATALNYVEAVGFQKRGRYLQSVEVRDQRTGETASVAAKTVINATGPWVDRVRALDGETTPVLTLSSGVHIVAKMDGLRSAGVLLPKTDDGRVLFVLPWKGHALIGTTDAPRELSDEPHSTSEEILFIQQQLSKHLGVGLSNDAILSSWAGLRPLWHGSAESTAGLSRDHHLQTSASGLITITGGKWTTYRKMAIDAVEACARLLQAAPESSKFRDSQTDRTLLTGAEGFGQDFSQRLMRDWSIPPDIAEHLAHTYGTESIAVLELAKSNEFARLHPQHGILEAEVEYSIRSEWACRSIDFLARRTRIAFLDRRATLECLPKVQAAFQRHFEWDKSAVAQDSEEVARWFAVEGHARSTAPSIHAS